MAQSLQQLRDEAITYLVLWAASREYSPDIEAVLKHWASTFEIPESELHNRIMAAADGKLTRPGASPPAAEPSSTPQAVTSPTLPPATEESGPAVISNSPAQEDAGQQQPEGVQPEGAQPPQSQ